WLGRRTAYRRFVRRLARLIARVPHPSTRTQWVVGLLVIITQSLIGVTGSVVRVTGSGLGCTAWPNCHPGTMFPTDHPEYATLNQWIEFGNRLLTGVVGATALAAVVIAWRLRQVDGRRRPLALALGVLHFLVSAVLIWLAVLLFTAFREGEREPRWLIGSVTHRLLQALVVALAAVLVAGTMVTGAGPHGGDPDTPRLALPIEVLAK